MKTPENTHFVQPTLGICPSVGGWVGRKILQRFSPLTPPFPNLPNLNIYIYKGRIAAHPAARAETKDGLVGWAGWQISHNARKSLANTVSNPRFEDGTMPNPEANPCG
jgi:hypothetical protein